MSKYYPTSANDPIEPPFKLPPQTYETQYDPLLGEVRGYWNSKLEEIVRVRAELHEKTLLYAVVEELRRKGYTVIEPEGDQGGPAGLRPEAERQSAEGGVPGRPGPDVGGSPADADADVPDA